MNFFVAVTDYDWFQLHASKPRVDEVNFWRPSSEAPFKALQAGELFLFKLHSPRNFIVGGGFFARFIQLPISLSWEAFGEANGVRSLSEMRDRIAKYRRVPIGPMENPTIGCILIAEPFFFTESHWIPIPKDFSLNIVQGKGYDSKDGTTGKALWEAVTERLKADASSSRDPGPATVAAVESARYGEPILVRPRLGQGTFRVIVTDAYERRCTITGERTLPVLQAAHIKPYGLGGPHEPENGLLLRTDASLEPGHDRRRRHGIESRSEARLCDDRGGPLGRGSGARRAEEASVYLMTLAACLRGSISPSTTASFASGLV